MGQPYKTTLGVSNLRVYPLFSHKLFLILAAVFASPLFSNAQCGFGGTNYGNVTPAGVGQTFSLPNFVWGGDQYTLSAQAGCTYTVSTCGGGFDSQITVFAPNFTVAGYNDDACGLQSQVTFTAAATGNYTIQVNVYFCGSNTTAIPNFNVTWVSCAGGGGCTNNPITVNMVDSFGDGWNGSVYTIVNSNGTTVASGGLPTGSMGSNNHCLPDGCYTMVVTAGSYPGEVSWSITGATLGTISGGAPANVAFAVGSSGAIGCTDPNAANYDPTALCDDGSCLDCYDSSPTGCPEIDAGADITLPECFDPCTNITLEAEFFETGATTSYTVCGIDYAPPYPFNTGTAIFINQDDVYGGVVNLPFNFCFYGNTYNQIVVGANGLVSFNTAYANAYCPWAFTATVPSAALPLNAIFGPYHDIDPSVCGNVRYAILGAAPCRVFVVNFDQVCHFSCNSLISSSQIVLYETTNAIEVYVANKPTCAGWNGGRAVIGIQNAAGSVGLTPNSRQTGPWTANNEAWRFTPDGASIVTVNWYSQADGFIGSGASIEVCPAEAVQSFVAEAVYARCDGTQITVSDAVNVTCAMVLLPVEWLDFQAALVNDDRHTRCTWQTATELNNDYFTVERSLDGLVWEGLGQVQGAGTTHDPQGYEWLDRHPYEGVSYYRIAQTDYNGAVDYSVIRSVERKKETQFAVYPNPGNQHFILKGYEMGDLLVFDALGRRVPFSLTVSGELTLHGAASGTYIIELRKEYSLESERIRLVVQ